MKSFKEVQCIQPAAGICGACDRIHSDRDVDGELFDNCVSCQVELVEILAEFKSRRVE